MPHPCRRPPEKHKFTSIRVDSGEPLLWTQFRVARLWEFVGQRKFSPQTLIKFRSTNSHRIFSLQSNSHRSVFSTNSHKLFYHKLSQMEMPISRQPVPLCSRDFERVLALTKARSCQNLGRKYRGHAQRPHPGRTDRLIPAAARISTTNWVMFLKLWQNLSSGQEKKRANFQRKILKGVVRATP